VRTNHGLEEEEHVRRSKIGAVVSLAALGALAYAASPTRGAQDTTPSVDPEAVALLRRATEFVGGLERFSVDAQTTFEDLLESGHRVDYELSGTATVRRPNRVRTERHGDHVNQVFFYDGESLTLYNPPDGVYATEAAPGTIEEMFQFAYDQFGISTPISDLVHRNPFPVLMQGVTLATVVGKEVIHGVSCDHLLFSRPDVDFQIWVADGESPLPLKYVVTDTTTPQLLSISATLRNWNTAPDVPDELFHFVPPEGAISISFMRADTAPEDQR
jgi:hypothetical protein